MNMCVNPPIKRNKPSKDIAYMIQRSDKVCIAVLRYQEDADEMSGRYNQEMKERGIETINFDVIAVPFYDE